MKFNIDHSSILVNARIQSAYVPREIRGGSSLPPEPVPSLSLPVYSKSLWRVSAYQRQACSVGTGRSLRLPQARRTSCHKSHSSLVTVYLYIRVWPLDLRSEI